MGSRRVGLWIGAAALVGFAAQAATPGPVRRTLPPPALEALRHSLREAAADIPAPESPYALQQEESKVEVGSTAPWDAKAKAWLGAAAATAGYHYDVPDDTPGLSAGTRALLGPIEVSVELNGEPRFAGLSSEGGPPSILLLKGATAVEIAAIAPGAVEGRVAAMTPREAEYRLAAITLFVGDPSTEAEIRGAVKNRTPLRPDVYPTPDPAEVHLIAVRIHGPRKPAEALARRIPAATLRSLLHR